MPQSKLPARQPGIAQKITIYFDGASVNRDPIWAYTVFVDGLKCHYETGAVPEDFGRSPLSAKFYALKQSLEFLHTENRHNDYVVFANDDPNTIHPMSRHWSAPKDPIVRALWGDCMRIAAPFANANFIWITKEENKAVL